MKQLAPEKSQAFHSTYGGMGEGLAHRFHKPGKQAKKNSTSGSPF